MTRLALLIRPKYIRNNFKTSSVQSLTSHKKVKIELTIPLTYKQISLPVPDALQLILCPFQRVARVKLRR